MNLRSFVEHNATFGSGPNFQQLGGGSYISAVAQSINDVERAAPILATLSWQILTGTPTFRKKLAEHRVRLAPPVTPEMIIVPHGNSAPYQFALLVLDRGRAVSESPVVEDIDPTDKEISEAWNMWRTRRMTDLSGLMIGGKQDAAARVLFDLIAVADEPFAIEAARLASYQMIVASHPEVIYTTVPNDVWGVAAPSGASTDSTVGAMVTNKATSADGVTVAYHALAAGSCASIGSAVDLVEVGGSGSQTGSVVSLDLISDSAVVELPDPKAMKQKPTSGPLAAVTPRLWEKADFDGLKSNESDVEVSGWSHDIPFVADYNQLKVFTDQVTRPGDSGAALVNKSDHILGFAFYETGLSGTPKVSAWIWAHSVFAAHNLKPL